MFNRKRALIFGLDSIIQIVDTDQGYCWQFDPQLPGILRDYHALGYSLVGILDPMAFGLLLENNEERLELTGYINGLLAGAGAPSFDAIHVSDDITDPRPLWELSRQVGFALSRSVLVGSTSAYEALRLNAGIGRMEWASEMLGEVVAAAG